jgi:DNA-binding response OmpR family regulator
MPMHAKTPVIFVTALNGFESKAKSSLSGGDDFIGKPFSYIELAVKALIYVLRGSINDKGPRKLAPVPESAAA